MKSRTHWPLPAAVVVSIFSLAGGLSVTDAKANGRFPRAERLLEDPANPERLLLSTTYGLLTTHDHGKTWYHTCEAEFAGLDVYNGDPLIELVADGATLVDLQYGINRSTDDCAWAQTLGTLVLQGHDIVEDLSVDRSTRKIVVALITSFVGSLTITRVKESTDGGVTWALVGTPLPLATAYTIDLDPNDPTHLYASGLSASGTPVMVASADHAATWTSKILVGADNTDLPYIAAIGSQNPGAIFVRTDSSLVGASGVPQGNDGLFYSGDGGSTWKLLLRKSAKLLGFALSPDGSRVLAGYGNDDSATSTDPSQLGIFEANTTDWSFAPVSAGVPVSCLTWTTLGTYVCTGPTAANDFEQLAFFANGTLVPGTPGPTPLLRFGDVVGPPPFCAEAALACDWTSFCALFSVCPDAGADAADAGDAPPEGSGGPLPHPDDATDADDATSLADATLPPDASAPTSGAKETPSGCACRFSAVGAPSSGGGAFFAFALSAFLTWRRRRHARP